MINHKRIGKILPFLTLPAYMLTVLWYTVLKRSTVFMIPKYELFWSYQKWLSGDTAIGGQILANVAMFIPFGLLMSVLVLKPAAHARRRKLMIIAAAACFSLLIEGLQLVCARGLFEFDDVFNNTLGALIGCALYRLLSLLPAKHDLLRTAAACAAVLAVCTGVVIDGLLNKAASSENLPGELCFQIDDAVLNGDRLLLTGCVFLYEQGAKEFSLILRSPKSEVSLSTELGLARADVNRYFECDVDYGNTGFYACGKVDPTEEYEVFLHLPWKASFSTGVYITGDRVHYAPSEAFIKPALAGTIMERVINDGQLRVFRPDYHCWVYQYEGSLYWIADQDFYFEDDGSTYIQYQLWTTQIQNLPQHRLENEWFWDNIGGSFEKHEVEGDFGQYRVMKRALPTEYAIKSIVTGYHAQGEWIWKEYFRPIYAW